MVSGDLRWEEERDGVQRSVDTDGDQHVHVDLPVLESVIGKLDVELISEGGTIGLKSPLDLDTLFFSQEFGTISG